MKRRRWLLAIFLLPLGALLVVGALNPGSVAQTSPRHRDVTLRTRRYKLPFVRARQIVRQTVPTLKTYGGKWRLDNAMSNGLRPLPGTEPQGYEEKLHIEVPVLFFTDDLTVTLRRDGDYTIVDARSASRVGKGDFGENARHLRQLLRALDAELAR
jgi:hypothetical protein